MLPVLALSAFLMQDPSAPPPPPAPPEAGARIMMMGPDGPGGLDKDGDGQVTRDEFSAPMNDAFGRLDKDGDGRLSTEELASGHGPGRPHVMTMRRPGGLEGASRIEFRRPGEDEETEVMVFAGRDGGNRRVIINGVEGEGGPHIVRRIGGDGEDAQVFVLSDRGDGEEIDHEVVVHALGRERGPRVRLSDGEHRDARVEVRRVGGPGGQDLDKDGDGKVSEAEFTAPLRDAFARMDADHSGFIENGERSGDGEVHVFAHTIETRRDGED